MNQKIGEQKTPQNTEMNAVQSEPDRKRGRQTEGKKENARTN